MLSINAYYKKKLNKNFFYKFQTYSNIYNTY